MELVIAQLWWIALGTFLGAAGIFAFLLLLGSVLARLYEQQKSTAALLGEAAQDVRALRREFDRLQLRRRPDGLRDVLTPQVPYDA